MDATLQGRTQKLIEVTQLTHAQAHISAHLSQIGAACDITLEVRALPVRVANYGMHRIGIPALKCNIENYRRAV